MRFGLVLLPPANVAERLARFAEALTSNKRARVVLGPNKLAHLSLLHVETDEAPDGLWREATERLPTTCSIEICSLGLLRNEKPYNAPPAGPASDAWLLAYCSPALRAMEQSALALPFVARTGVTTQNGDRFQPHFTLAVWEGAPGVIDEALPRDLAAEPRFEGRLALGIIGANGVYERSLFEA